MRKFSFPPISNNYSKALILGTMPGKMSLKLNQYYGHGGNQFWKLIFNIFNEPFSTEYEKRKDVLIKNHIALWDVLKACVREGSSDNAILEEESNDFETFFDNHPNLELIAFNGKNAEGYFNRFCRVKPAIETVILPSTSPANTWKKFEEKLSEWKEIKNRNI
jgi:hypoxanthine-DNA glycosylase